MVQLTSQLRAPKCSTDPKTVRHDKAPTGKAREWKLQPSGSSKLDILSDHKNRLPAKVSRHGSTDHTAPCQAPMRNAQKSARYAPSQRGYVPSTEIQTAAQPNI